MSSDEIELKILALTLSVTLEFALHLAANRLTEIHVRVGA